jgi:hypothetical protein
MGGHAMKSIKRFNAFNLLLSGRKLFSFYSLFSLSSGLSPMDTKDEPVQLPTAQTRLLGKDRRYCKVQVPVSSRITPY